jgi:hypothetical protein
MSEHEPECSLALPCSISSPEHDHGYSADFCRACERSCTCPQLHAYEERILGQKRDWSAE